MSFVKEINIGIKKKLTDTQRQENAARLKAAMKEDSKLVKGIFKNIEAPGGDLEFSYRAYRDEPIRVYYFKDGETYEIPLGVAKHINRQCTYKKSKFLIDKDGKQIIGADKPIQRYQFISTEYM